MTMAKIQNKYQFQYYPAKAYEMQPSGFISLENFIRLHISNDNKQLFDRIAQAEKDSDR